MASQKLGRPSKKGVAKVTEHKTQDAQPVMALPSADLLDEVLKALQDWELILYYAYHHEEHLSSKTLFEQELASARRLTNEDSLLKAQQRRAAFLRSPAAQFVVPAPFSITYWYDEPKKIAPELKVIRKAGASKRLNYVPTRPKFLRRTLGQPPSRARQGSGPKAQRPAPKEVRHQAKVTTAMALARQLGML